MAVLPESITILADLVDRGPQWDRLSQVLRQRQKENRLAQPLFVVLEGVHQDLPRCFVKRCAREAIPQLLKLGSALTPGSLDTWPRDAADLDDLIGRVAGQLGLASELSREEIAASIAARSQSTAFGLLMKRQDWAMPRRDRIAGFVQEVHRSWRPQHPSALLVVFCCVIVDPSEGQLDPEVSALKELLVKDAGQEGVPEIIKLDRLKPVECEDLVVWLTLCETIRSQRNLPLATDYLETIIEIYEGVAQGVLPMLKVHGSVLRYLEQAYRPETSFTVSTPPLRT